MERAKLSFCSGVLRVAMVFAMAPSLSIAQNLQAQTSDSPFCDTFAVPYGYNCRQYTAITSDGFLLAAHRISSKPRTRSKSQSTTAAEAPAPLPPLCTTTAEKPFETIRDFVRNSDEPESSRMTGVNCIPGIPTPPLAGTVQEAAPTQAQPLSGPREGPEVVEKHEADIGGETFLPLATSKANLVQASIGQRRIGYMPELGFHIYPTESSSLPVVFSSPDAGTAQQTIDSLDEVTPLPETQPDSQSESYQDEDLTAATPDSQSPVASPSSSRGPTLAERREPVLLMHHEFQNGNSWFIHTNDDSDQLFPFLLLNAGFDVWVGHQRATYYAHEHITLTPDDQSYWNWTWDEHANYDMPALLELVKTETGLTVHFVGISQSATAGAAAATIPLVSLLLRSLTLIGPTIYRGNTSSRTLNAWGALLARSNAERTYYYTEFKNGVFNLSTTKSNYSILSSLGSVSALWTDISGPNCCLGSKFKVKFDNAWDGTTSLKNVMHYQQGISTNTWSHFDYGSVRNNSLAYNGSPLPPIYDPEDIPATLPVLMIYGGADNIAPPSGARQFMSQLRASPSRNNSAAVLLPAYAHFDLMNSVSRTQDVFIPVVQFLERLRTLQ